MGDFKIRLKTNQNFAAFDGRICFEAAEFLTPAEHLRGVGRWRNQTWENTRLLEQFRREICKFWHS